MTWMGLERNTVIGMTNTDLGKNFYVDGIDEMYPIGHSFMYREPDALAIGKLEQPAMMLAHRRSVGQSR